MSETLAAPVERFVHPIEAIDPTDTRRFGGKATGLARMARAGIPVPPAFVIGTDAFHAFRADGRRLPRGLDGQIRQAVALLGARIDRVFEGGPADRPLLVSVRSGAQVSMPGMMDTVLNLGLTAASAGAWIAQGAGRGFVVDCWLRFWKMYIEIVLGLDGENFTDALAAARAEAEAGTLALDRLEAAVVGWIEAEGEDAPIDPWQQLERAVAAVFRSWDSPRAKAYRKHHGIADDLGTAVTVQAMVFGNADGNSGAGVAFSRNPNTGEALLYGEYLVGRQGEDIVSGARTPVDLSRAEGHGDLLRALNAHAQKLEEIYGDAVDIEFTVEAGTLYLLQVRPAKRTALAAVRIAAELADEGRLPPARALGLVSADQVKRLLRPVFDDARLQATPPIASAIGSSPGQASGIAVLDADRAAERAAAGEPVILVRPTTSPLDIRGMLAAGGILTAKGGALSHAAVVSRALDKPCVVGCEALAIDLDARRFTIGGQAFAEGDALSIDGTTGAIYGTALPLGLPTQQTRSLGVLLERADALSGAAFWAPARGLGDIAAGSETAGHAVIAVTDIAIAEGHLDALIGAIKGLKDGVAPGESDLARLAETIGAAIFRTAAGRPVHLRLPRVTSERARLRIPGWEELDPRLLLPLGHPAYLRAILHGLSKAAVAAGSAALVLLGGTTDIAEWRAFKAEIASFPALDAGLAIQNAAALEQAPQMIEDGAFLWLDMDELLSSSHGFASERLLPADVLADYVGKGLMAGNPRAVLKPFLARLIEALGGLPRTARQVGIDAAGGSDPALLKQLHGLGFRLFSLPPGQLGVARLVLGQQAARRL
ncbi:pyruvate, phosphate dikinase [Zavarzinia compransoris]|uniref:Pyruvate, phosphate dikinase n=1 Tax=Zavarzinia compransoris TaxID=1264899 RepID=A0A317E5P3_9PROT|nr:pyruvate, phosphate dikinase [Zavarzinia compransoris]PWR21674.1 pyruvate, phosphate dikinase [Zavarzinia compransoris]TDP45543.1 pyruvate,orthophosphate dikinase [Zavarzinia compransoris]